MLSFRVRTEIAFKVSVEVAANVSTDFLMTVGEVSILSVVDFFLVGIAVALFVAAVTTGLLVNVLLLCDMPFTGRSISETQIMICDTVFTLVLFHFIEKIHQSFQFFFIGKRNADLAFSFGVATHLHFCAEES